MKSIAPGELILVVMRVLSVHVKEDETMQWENMIIDEGSCTNVVSTIMVEKLGLSTLKYLRPYKL